MCCCPTLPAGQTATKHEDSLAPPPASRRAGGWPRRAPERPGDAQSHAPASAAASRAKRRQLAQDGPAAAREHGAKHPPTELAADQRHARQMPAQRDTGRNQRAGGTEPRGARSGA